MKSFAMHLLGGVVGGALTAALAFAVLRAVDIGEALRWSVAFAVVAVAFAFDTKLLPFGVPGPRRQVPERWRSYFSPATTAFLYGAGLGTGLTTRVYFATTYAVFLGAALLLPFSEALVVGACFGASRSAGVWVAFRGASLERLHTELSLREARRLAVRMANLAVLAALALVLVFS
ncbi:MAG: hypothetical protein M3321_03245 [Actinomycetota bacterium]|nr:hypothetical protein [Actinomycetota bacterium]